MGAATTDPTTPPADAEVVVLDAVPDLGALYGRAALGAANPFDGEGDALPSVVLEVRDVSADAERARRYAEVCGFRLGDVLPSTLVHVMGFPVQVALLTRGDFPFDLPGLVHVRQVITQHRPVRVGEPVTLRTWVSDLRPHRVGVQFDAHLVAEVDGEVAWQGLSTNLRRGDGRDPDVADEGPDVDLDPRGDALRIDVPESTGRRYASVSGDRNPIHLHAVTARAFGFPRAIVHGMWSMARVLASMEGRVDDAHRYEVRFDKPVLLPSKVRLSTRRTDDGWDLALHAARPREDGSVIRHLAGHLR